MEEAPQQQNNETNNQDPFDSNIKRVCDRRSRLMDLAKQQKRTLNKKANFLIAYDRAFGIISAACKLTGIKSRKTVYNWIASDPEFKRAMDDTQAIQYDFANDMLMMNIARGDGASVRWFLSHKHPDYMLKRISRPPQKKKRQKTLQEQFDEAPDEDDPNYENLPYNNDNNV